MKYWYMPQYDEPWKNNAEWINPDIKDYRLCNPVYMKYPKQAK